MHGLNLTYIYDIRIFNAIYVDIRSQENMPRI